MKLLCALLLLLGAFGALPAARACSCDSVLPPLKALAKADAVFSGTVTALARKPIRSETSETDGVEATVTIAKSWKGQVAGQVLVVTGNGRGDCGFSFQEGQAYLFYVYRSGDERWSTSICERTSLLATAFEEILELEGRLPIPTTPAREPQLVLKGRLRDQGYDGYVFTLHNHRHERIFYLGAGQAGSRVQILRAGQWVDYPPNQGLEPLAAELSEEEAAQVLADWKASCAGPEYYPSTSYLNRQSGHPLFVASPTQRVIWRIGFPYLTEPEVDLGWKIASSTHFVWSEPIEKDTPAPMLSFEQAFR